jgi:HPr kinase/phosphorylase
MPRISIARCLKTTTRLKLEWRLGRDGADKTLDSEFTKDSSQGLIGHLNFIHPNLIQVLGVSEIRHLESMDTAYVPQPCARWPRANLHALSSRGLRVFRSRCSMCRS